MIYKLKSELKLYHLISWRNSVNFLFMYTHQIYYKDYFISLALLLVENDIVNIPEFFIQIHLTCLSSPSNPYTVASCLQVWFNPDLLVCL